MTLTAAFADLHTRLGLVEQTLDSLLWAVSQGRPANEPHQAMADRYETAAIDMLALVRQALGAVPADEPPPDLNEARHRATSCQESHNVLLPRFYAEALAWREDRDRLRRGGGAAWAIWSTGLDDAMAPLPGQFYDVGQALLHVWQELVEWTSLFSTSLHALGRQHGDAPAQERVFGSPQMGVDV